MFTLRDPRPCMIAGDQAGFWRFRHHRHIGMLGENCRRFVCAVAIYDDDFRRDLLLRLQALKKAREVFCSVEVAYNDRNSHSIT